MSLFSSMMSYTPKLRKPALFILLSLWGFVVIACAPAIKEAIPEPADKGQIKQAGVLPYQWNKGDLPIEVIYDNSVPLKTLAALEIARQQLYIETGLKLFLQPRAALDMEPIEHKILPVGIVYIINLPPEKQNSVRIGWTRHSVKKSGAKMRIISAVIALPKDKPLGMTIQIAKHELLHALGLDHDALKMSIMFPSLHSPKQEITKSDVRLLKYLYTR